MTEENQASEEQAEQEAPAPEAPAQEPAAQAAPAADSKEVEDGKIFAILSYVLNFVGLPFFLVPLIMRNNAFSLYHAKQCLMWWIAGAVLMVASSILMAVCIGAILMPLSGVFLLVLNIMGLISATKLEQKPLPLIGKWGEDWFKGIQKA